MRRAPGLSRSERVTSASLAQLVNVIAPIMTAPGGPAGRVTSAADASAALVGGRLVIELPPVSWTTAALS